MDVDGRNGGGYVKFGWMIIVAYPLRRAGALAGSPADEMAHTFVWTRVLILIVPWKYVLQNYVMWLKTKCVSGYKTESDRPTARVTWWMRPSQTLNML